MKEIIEEPSPNIDENLTKEFLLKTPPRYLSPSQIKLRRKYKRQSVYVPKHKKIIQKISDHENKLLLSLPKNLTVNEKIERQRIKRKQRYKLEKNIINNTKTNILSPNLDISNQNDFDVNNALMKNNNQISIQETNKSNTVILETLDNNLINLNPKDLTNEQNIVRKKLLRKLNEEKKSSAQKQKELDLRKEKYANLHFIEKNKILLKRKVRFDNLTEQEHKKQKIYHIKRFDNLDKETQNLDNNAKKRKKII